MHVTVLLLVFAFQIYNGRLSNGHPPPEHKPPHTAATEPNPQYPLKVHLLSAERVNDKHGTTSFGSGNLLQQPMVGFDYKSDCYGGFLHNGLESEYYQGRWKTQDRKIEILSVETGSSHVDKCDISITEKPKPYGPDNRPPRLPSSH